MPPDVSTLNDDLSILSDREFLEAFAAHVEDLAAEIRREQDITRKQLDHIDTMCHETAQFIDEHRPALARALAFLSPGTSVRDYFRRGRDAVPQDRPRPV